VPAIATAFPITEAHAHHPRRTLRRPHRGTEASPGAGTHEATARTLGCTPDGVDVIFQDIERHDWATGGKLWSEKAQAPKPA